MLGAAIGGIVLGKLGDTLRRTRALGMSILFYSVFAGTGAFVKTQEQMLLLRFLVGLGVGGVWPNAVALAPECWPNRSRPIVAGLMDAALNRGILMLCWLPLYLPELFPTRVRAAGTGIAYNVWRFATALGVLLAGGLFAAMGGSYPKVGATCGLVYLLGLIVIWWAPDTTATKLEE